ncbi:16S rRNA (guanine(527)-N(7))-methyltransferase RsmG [Ideonella livida]|uniref:Ribosomal RNA small subunit methyltransferase G n=1 Tax=Ideonella livida TaxID=2707176 RepID=A0A7C9TMF7_9BURK|nr:16S rRNA (guanine(527)-N(7))-methyltransferase RsmG [Ideonella livida]NDY93184.1 16S rRNA (guanine(527)-N(7))-methyltransferase RsmG [Ideonella livida]
MPSASQDLKPLLTQGLSALALDLDAATVDGLLAYLDLIGRWNKVYNLTAIRDPREMLHQHLLDCLAVVPPLRTALAGLPAPRVLDVGSGAGLPGVVLALCNPGWTVHCVDTVAKKATFIRQVAAELGLTGRLVGVHARVEAMDSTHDLVTSRAFASLADFTHLTRARLAPGARWAAMKARLSEAERAELPADVRLLQVEPLRVPGLDAERCLVWLQPA